MDCANPSTIARSLVLAFFQFHIEGFVECGNGPAHDHRPSSQIGLGDREMMLVREVFDLQNVVGACAVSLQVLFVGEVLAFMRGLRAFAHEFGAVQRCTRPEPHRDLNNFIGLGGCNDS
jgi:hypothetical protein